MTNWHKALLLGTACTLLAGCGIKPGSLQPADPEKDEYPRAYPNIETDPAPQKMMRRL